MRDDLEAALESAGVGLWSWVVGSESVRWSPQIERLFGLPAGSFDGTFERYLGAIHPDDRQWVKGLIEACLAPGAAPLHFEHRIVVGESVRWLECRGRVERDAGGTPQRMLGTVMDITPRKEAQLALEQSATALRLISELTSDYVYLGDEEDSPVPRVVAGSFERIVGFTTEQVRARGGWLSIIHPEDRQKAVEMLGALKQGQPLVGEYRIIDASGETRWLRDTMRPVLEGGRLVKLTGAVKEITREKQLEQQWLQAQKLEALARLAGGIAHDFNNVLAVIQSGIDVVVRRAGVAHDEVLTDVRDATERAAELTRGLLSFARRPLGAPQVLAMDAELNGLKAVLVRGLGERHQLSFEIDAAGVAVRIEPGQLQVLLLNLVLNARDSMPEGGPVRVSARALSLDANDRRRPANLAPGRYFVIEVSDTGCGMGSEVMAHLFEPFFTTKGARGTGLGLPTCHGISLRANGGLTVQSAMGKGTTFWVVLPIAAEQPAPHTEANISIGGVERLLLVEDEPALRRVARRALVERGYAVLDVGSAEEALSLPEDQFAGISLVVSDVGLPGMNGTTLVQKLVERYPRLKVLLTSGYLPDEQAKTTLARGNLHFLPKPFSADGLARRVREVLDE
ncbi:MAG: PAS domain-containing protein [Archangium sp.]|nr:PAS domain-containing protein [Archangium sp.]